MLASNDVQVSAGVRRRRSLVTGMALMIGACGLASRRYADVLPSFLATYAGDTLWAAMVFWIVAWFRPAAHTWRLAVIALAISAGVEVSQLYHAPWIDSVRASRLGALVLGQGFLWSDLACYAAGVSIGAAIDLFLHRPRDTSSRPSPR